MTPRGGRGWAYVGALLGGAVSVAANVAHSYVPPAPPKGAPAGWAEQWSPHAGAVIGAVFWPVALFVAIEILARTAWPSGWRWGLLRFGGLSPVALVAAVVSYRHLSGLLAFYAEDALTVAIGPLAVDGLMIVSAGALIATGARRVATDADTTRSDRGHGGGHGAAIEADTMTAPASGIVATPVDIPRPSGGHSADTAVDTAADALSGPVSADVATPADTTVDKQRTPRRRDTAARVAKLAARKPDLTAEQIAARLDLSPRTVRRHLPPRPLAAVTPISREEANQ